MRVECAEVSGYACDTVTKRLRALGIPAAIAAIGSGGEPQTLRVEVAPWTEVRGDPAVQSIERGPRASGVYARFTGDGRMLTLLDRDGRTARTLTAGAGLIAATRNSDDVPVWVVTGTDGAGVEHAAKAFEEAMLQDRFAVAVTTLGAGLSVPDAGS